jgi:hypothetical protein
LELLDREKIDIALTQSKTPARGQREQTRIFAVFSVGFQKISAAGAVNALNPVCKSLLVIPGRCDHRKNHAASARRGAHATHGRLAPRQQQCTGMAASVGLPQRSGRQNHASARFDLVFWGMSKTPRVDRIFHVHLESAHS